MAQLRTRATKSTYYAGGYEMKRLISAIFLNRWTSPILSVVARPLLFLLRHPRTLTVLTWSSSISASVAAIAGVYNGFAVFDIVTLDLIDKTAMALMGPALSITALVELIRRAIRERVLPALNAIVASGETG